MKKIKKFWNKRTGITVRSTMIAGPANERGTNQIPAFYFWNKEGLQEFIDYDEVTNNPDWHEFKKSDQKRIKILL